MNGNKSATGQILKRTGRSCEGADFSWLSSKALPNPEPEPVTTPIDLR